KLRSCFSSAIAPNSFLRKVPLTITVSSSARKRIRADADVSGANSSPQGPLQTQRRAGRLPPSLTKAAASKDRLELAPTGGISSCRQATPIEQPGRRFAPRLRCSPALASLPPYVHSCFTLSFVPASARARHSA